eukprot:CAMPEP_0197080476 /NCGR_PEP_ID=MMETSP1384-20130603/214150_1 /TAXON_ID=29189 /ORGANISM="Ammonia sp." /LENGTH=426 /DNA_ID=CAMNT_0042519363 /DNA_START=716 /DNA_END=1997 /DNA_ORIENTATION=-
MAPPDAATSKEQASDPTTVKQNRPRKISWFKNAKKPSNYLQLCEILVAGYARDAEQSLLRNASISFIPSAISRVIFGFYASPSLPRYIYVNLCYGTLIPQTGVYQVDISDINSTVPIQQILNVQFKDDTPMCYVANISDYHPYFCRIREEPHAIHDAIVHLSFNHMANAWHPEFVAFEARLLDAKRGQHVHEHDLIRHPLQEIEIDERVNQFLFCKQYGIIYNDMWSITRIQWDEQNVVNRHELKRKPESMRMLYLEQSASVFFIGNGRNKSIQKAMMYDLEKERVTDIAGYEYQYISCRNQTGVRFRTGLCVHTMDTNKVYLASNLGHVSVYDAERDAWSHLYYDAEMKHNLMMNNFVKAPLIWCNDYQPRVLYALQADRSDFAALKYLYFDTRDCQKKGWNLCRADHECEKFYRFPWKDATWFH